VRSEVPRKPGKVTKALTNLLAIQPAERKRKALLRLRQAPTKEERRRDAKRRRRWLNVPRRRRREDVNPAKRRRVYGNTFWRHSDDV